MSHHICWLNGFIFCLHSGAHTGRTAPAWILFRYTVIFIQVGRSDIHTPLFRQTAINEPVSCLGWKASLSRNLHLYSWMILFNQNICKCSSIPGHSWAGNRQESSACLFMRCSRVCDSRCEIKVNPPRVRCGGRALMCWAESVFKSTFNTILLSSTYREVSPLWPSRGRLRCTSNSSSTWGKLTARSSTSPSRKRPKGGRQKGGQMDGGTTRLRLRGWVGWKLSEQEVLVKQTFDRVILITTSSSSPHLAPLTAPVWLFADILWRWLKVKMETCGLEHVSSWCAVTVTQSHTPTHTHTPVSWVRLQGGWASAITLTIVNLLYFKQLKRGACVIRFIKMQIVLYCLFRSTPLADDSGLCSKKTNVEHKECTREQTVKWCESWRRTEN